MNTIPCGKCKNYDQVFGRGVKPLGTGRCTKLSIYPDREGPGQVFPVDARRAAPGEPANIKLVNKDQVEKTCIHAEAK